MTLSHDQLEALRNLSRKKAGFEVGWVAIAPACELTELGLAARDRSGWRITAEGEAALQRQHNPVQANHLGQPLPFPSRVHVANHE